MNWSPQQQAFIDWAVDGQGSCVLEAVAGAGKTTTLLEAAERMPGAVTILAYNKKIAQEIKGKLQRKNIDWKKAQASTVHSAGYRAYRKTFPQVQVNERKLDELTIHMQIPDRIKHAVVTATGLAKQRAIGVVTPIGDPNEWQDLLAHFDVLDNDEDAEEVIDWAERLLRASNKQTDVIDFDDMVYMPLVHRCRFWRQDVVIVDEAQDTNPARRALVRSLVRPGGRVIAVGDRHQAIYGFTGADNNSLDLIAQDFNAQRLPLTTSYRCPQAVIAFAKQWVSHIEAHPDAPQGRVSSTNFDAFFQRNDLNGQSAVLCRNVKPLVSLAMQMIRAKIACKIEGREIGNTLKRLANRWKVKTLEQLRDKLATFLEKERTKLLAKKQETRAQQVEDMVETLYVIIDEVQRGGKNNLGSVNSYIDELFANDVENMITLSTIHKSKGREWPRVFWLDRHNTCPSKYARQQWQQEQEVNLQYVAATRAQEELIDLIPTQKEVK
jgi:DNA helicase-2/ATP-dependent DNA helicase PcrA